MKIRIISFIVMCFAVTVFSQSNASSSPFFVENKGQWSDDILFKTALDGMDVWVTEEGVVYNFMEYEIVDTGSQVIHNHAVSFKLNNPGQPSLQLSDELSGFYNYYLGNNPDNWATDVKRYHVGQLNGMYNNIDLKYYFDTGQLRYDYIVHVNGNPSDIRFQILGSDGYTINSVGELEIQTQLGVVTHKGLKLYQLINGQQVDIPGSFVYTTNGIGIEVGDYDPTQDLIIDPVVWYTFLGGTGYDVPNDVAVGWVGSKIFTTGSTSSGDFPTSLGAYSTNIDGTKDAFVTSFSETNKFEYSTFFGGQQNDEAFALSLDLKTNQIHFVGMTTSSNNDGFPLSHAFDDAYNGGKDVFVASLLADGGTLVYSSYYGGTDDDIGYDIVTSNDGYYITGVTNSFDLPVQSAFQDQLGGKKDVFIAKFTPASPLELSYSTYLGGDEDDVAQGIGLDGSGKVYVAGYSNGGTFPNLAISGDFGTSGGKDAFVSCIDVDQNVLVYSGCLGGNLTDVANDIVVNSEGDAFITGYAVSENYPTTVGVHKELHTDDVDAFVTKIVYDGNLALLGYSTFVGGNGSFIEKGNAITLCGDNVFFTGVTNSSDFFNPPGNIIGLEAFLASLDGSGANLTGQFIGGVGQQTGSGISFGSPSIYVVGKTNAHFGNNPLEPFSGNEDGFIAALEPSCNSCRSVVISTDQSWPTDTPPAGPFSLISVTSGATLTIEPGYEVLFCPDGTLDIASGCKVDLYGTLSSYATEWDGVRMGGNINTPSSFFADNGSKISNAQVAISNMSNISGVWAWGIVSVDCKGTNFENNRMSIQLNNSGSFPVRFRKCDFVINSSFSAGIPEATQVTLNNVNKAYFMGCTFDNQIECFNNGILASNCNLNVSDYCEGVQNYPCPEQYLTHSSFTHMPIGVLVTGSRPSIVANTEFDNCQYGLMNIGQSASSFYGNTFLLGDMPSIFGGYIIDGQQFQLGISYYAGINGMNCVNNKFFGNPTSLTHTMGIHTYDVGSFENLIEGNTFDGLTRANVAEKINASEGLGLNYTCNENMNNSDMDFHAMDMSSVRPVIADVSGVLFGPARNTFSKNSSPNLFRDFNNEGNLITYYHRDIANEIPVYVQNVVNIPNLSPKSCPNDEKDPCKYCLTKDEQKVNLETYFAEALLAAQAKENYEAMKQSGNTVAAKTHQEEWQYHRHLMELAADLGYGSALVDTTHYNRDTVRLWMRRFDNITGYYMLIDDYLSTREIGMAKKFFTAIPKRYVLTSEEWIDYQNVEIIYDYLFKTPDIELPNDVLTELCAFAESKKGHACALARKVLAVRGIIYPPIISIPNGYNSSEDEVFTTKMSVSPNPTDYNVTFDWNEFLVDGDIVIEITDQLGGLIEVLRPVGVKAIEWTTENVSGTLCNYRLLIGGVEKDRGIIVISK